jgi:hypothetical protein
VLLLWQIAAIENDRTYDFRKDLNDTRLADTRRSGFREFTRYRRTGRLTDGMISGPEEAAEAEQSSPPAK